MYVKSKKIISVLSEELYKTYQRKLQKPMRVAEKHYYHDLLVKYSNDMKEIMGYHKTYDKQEPETTYSKQIQNWG